jgi:hypothetical protein
MSTHIQVAVDLELEGRGGSCLSAANLANSVARQHDINEPWWIGDTNFILTTFETFLTTRPEALDG